MVLAFVYSHRDAAQARKLADRMVALGSCSRHDLLVVANPAGREAAPEIFDKLAPLFSVSTRITVDVPEAGWPKSPNAMFYHTAVHLDRAGNKQPWYFFEPDNCPMRPGWLDVLWAEHQTGGKSYTGWVHNTRLVDRTTGQFLRDAGSHMVGTGIYPPDQLRRSWLMTTLNDVAFDVHLQAEIMQDVLHTELIQHNWLSKNYRREGGQIVCDPASPIGIADPVRVRAVVVHGCKDESLLDLLATPRELPTVPLTGRPITELVAKDVVDPPVPAKRPLKKKKTKKKATRNARGWAPAGLAPVAV